LEFLSISLVYFFLPQEKVTKRTLSPTAVSDEFSPQSLKFLVLLRKNRQKFLHALSAEFVPESSVKADFFKLIFFKIKKALRLSERFLLFSLGRSFDATDADFFAGAVDFFGLQIDAKSSAGGNIGMASLVSTAGISSADCADFTHKIQV